MSAEADFKTVAEFYGNFTDPNPSFAHLLFSHRQQRFMMLKMLELLSKSQEEIISHEDFSVLKDMFDQYEILFNVHSGSEDLVLMPQLIKRSPDEATKAKFVDMKANLDSQHSNVESLLKKTKIALASTTVKRQEFSDELKAFARAYHEHTLYEENQVIAEAFNLPADLAKEIAKSVGQYFRESEGVKHSLYAMQEIAYLNSRDTDIWCNSLPWFVRNVVVKMIGMSSDVARYYNAFGTPTAGFDANLAKKLYA